MPETSRRIVHPQTQVIQNPTTSGEEEAVREGQPPGVTRSDGSRVPTRRDPVIEKVKSAWGDHPLERRLWGGLSGNILSATAKWTTRYGFMPQLVLQNKRNRKKLLATSLPRLGEGVAMDTMFSKATSRDGNVMAQVGISQVSKRIFVYGLAGSAPNEGSIIDYCRRLFTEWGANQFVYTSRPIILVKNNESESAPVKSQFFTNFVSCKECES